MLYIRTITDKTELTGSLRGEKKILQRQKGIFSKKVLKS